MTIWWEFSLNVPVAFHDQTLDWQVAFPECHCWEVRVQQTGVNQPELQILSNGSYEKPVLKTNFRSNRWYHFGIFTDGVTNKFYFSENHADLKFIDTLSPGCDIKNEAFKEYHFGLLSYQKGVHKKLPHAEKIWFSGISAHTKINDSKIKGGGGTGSKSAEQNEGPSGGSNYGNQNEDKPGENAKGEKPPVKNDSEGTGDYTPGNQNGGNNGGTSQSGEKPPVKNESGGSGESPTPPTNNKKCKRST
ncbi:unnamed protein product [Albugo candida]|uniref:Glycoside hydrolase 131 catalytic N-terminal domain-containing protein n=1 Tax=Albugo candida TaxID=65357 RepID=A0A024GRB0_9STRA|nr:unnamed protein product [Albugo candida]|eukprot:CCI49098.1 unnamed protein product [Albugo candida]